MAKSNVLLVGGGAVGAIAAVNIEMGCLGAVSIVLRSNYEQVQDHGYTITSVDHGVLNAWRPTKIMNRVPDVLSASLPQYDYVICCLKNCPDIPPTISSLIAPAITPGHTVIVMIQNGLNIEKPLFKAFPNNIVLSGVSYIAAREDARGHIQHEKSDTLSLGPFHNPNIDHEGEKTAALKFINMYTAAGKTCCTYCDDVQGARWRKCILNSTVNPISAITGLDLGQQRLATGTIDGLVRPAMNEVVATATALGYTFPKEIVDQMIAITPVDLYVKPSMQLDVESGRYIEFETLLGEPLREAEKAGVLAPTLKLLYETCRAIQWKTKLANGLVVAPPKRTL